MFFTSVTSFWTYHDPRFVWWRFNIIKSNQNKDGRSGNYGRDYFRVVYQIHFINVKTLSDIIYNKGHCYHISVFHGS